jgi:outer membrane receptor protein involved in Fe transport
VLEKISGVNNVSTGSQAGKPLIRGMTGERVKIVSNGSGTDFQTFGARHLANIDPFLADRIEVIRGTQSVLYGSDAIGGVVNVVNAPYLTSSEVPFRIKGEMRGEYNTNNNEWATGIKSQLAKGKLGLNIGLSQRVGGNFSTGSSSAWSNGAPLGTNPRFSGKIPFTNFETISALVGLGYSDTWGKVSLQHTLWESYQNYLGHTAIAPYSGVSAAGQKLANQETQARGEFLLGEWVLKSSYSKTLNRREAATSTPYEFMGLKKRTADYLDIGIQRDEVKIGVVHPPVSVFQGELGVEVLEKKQTLYEGKMSPSAQESGKSFYLFEEVDIGKWILTMGGRYDTREIKAYLDGPNAPFVEQGIFNTSNNNQKFSSSGGSLGLSYKINDNVVLAASLSQGFRAPSIFELYAGGIHGGVQAFQIGNPLLKEERTIGGDISLRFNFSTLKSSLSLYQNYINNYIYLANTGYYRDANGGRFDLSSAGRLPEMINEQTQAKIEGLEWTFDAMIIDRTRLTGALELIKGYDITNNRRLPLIPAGNFKTALYYDLGSNIVAKNNVLWIDMKYAANQSVAGNFEPFAQYNDKTKFPFGSADTKSYSLWGLGYKSEVEIFSKAAQLHIKVSNLFDKAYSDYLDTYKGYTLGMGRNIMFSLRIPFGR